VTAVSSIALPVSGPVSAVAPADRAAAPCRHVTTTFDALVASSARPAARPRALVPIEAARLFDPSPLAASGIGAAAPQAALVVL
jgi:hypothetical protein